MATKTSKPRKSRKTRKLSGFTIFGLSLMVILLILVLIKNEGVLGSAIYGGFQTILGPKWKVYPIIVLVIDLICLSTGVVNYEKLFNNLADAIVEARKRANKRKIHNEELRIKKEKNRLEMSKKQQNYKLEAQHKKQIDKLKREKQLGESTLTINDSRFVSIVYMLIVITLAIIALMPDLTGFLGVGLSWLFGYGWLIILVFGVLALISIIWRKPEVLADKNIIALVLLFFGLIIITSIPADHSLVSKEAIGAFFEKAKSISTNGLKSAGGGILGALLYGFISALVSFVGTVLVASVLFVAAIGLMCYKYRKQLSTTISSASASVEKQKAKLAEKKAEKQQKQSSEAKPARKPKHKIDFFEVVDDYDDDTETIETIDNETDVLTAEEVVDEVSDFVKEEKYEEPQQVLEEVKPEQTVVEKPIVNEERPTQEIKVTQVVDPFKNYRLPRASLLEPALNSAGNDNDNKNNANNKAAILMEVLDEYECHSELVDIKIGPSVTKFEVRPARGIKLNKFLTISDNLKMELAVKDLRIEAPVPGKNVVGIEIENNSKSMVKIRELLEKDPNKDNPLSCLLGKNLSGDYVFLPIDKMPHLLVAGSTGSGKSVCLNSLIISILMKASPKDVRLVLIDPKKVEFSDYVDVPHLLGPVITDTTKAANALKKVVEEMDKRYSTFENVHVRNISEYNAKAKNDPNVKEMYKIVVVVEELADLMVEHKKEVEPSIQRITQLARAAGIYLIVATQRPSTDVITGVIKANIPSRIAMLVSNAIDSRVIIDETGAENLLGNGDMLYKPAGENHGIRVQGVYVSDEEIKRVTDYCKSQSRPYYLDSFVLEQDNEGNSEFGGLAMNDPMYEDVKRWVIKTQKVSASQLQRYFGFGFNRAARMVDYLEQEGVIGPNNGSKPREVLVKEADK